MKRRDLIIGGAALTAATIALPALATAEPAPVISDAGWTPDRLKWLAGWRDGFRETDPTMPSDIVEHAYAINEFVSEWVPWHGYTNSPTMLVDGKACLAKTRRLKCSVQLGLAFFPRNDIARLMNEVIALEVSLELSSELDKFDNAILHGVYPVRMVNSTSFQPEIGYKVRYALSS